MPTLQALLQLLDHERRTRDEALQALSRAEGMAGQADAQAQALNVHRNEYIERWTLSGDIKILLMTVPHLLMAENAY